MSRLRTSMCIATAIVLTLGLVGPLAAGDQVPFKGVLEGTLADRIPFPAPPVFRDRIESTGTATRLGDFELVQIAVVNLGVVPSSAEGIIMFVAANGDTLTAEFRGTSVLVGPGIVLITENATVTGGTGRFANATGKFTIQRLFDRVTLETAGYFEGSISNPGQ